MESIFRFLSYFLVCVYLNFFNATAQQQINKVDFTINQFFQLNNEASLLLNNKIAFNSNRQLQDEAVLLNQFGNNNQIEILSKINKGQTVTQLGNNNDYYFTEYYNNISSNLSIYQYGNANSLQIFGNNSLIKRMSITQKANFETLIIKNY